MPVVVFQVIRPISKLGAEPGDFLIVRPGHHRPFLLQRTLTPSLLPVLSEPGSVEPIPLIRQSRHRPQCQEDHLQCRRQSLHLME